MATQVMEDRRINVFDRRSHEDRRETERNKVALEATAGGSFIEMAGGIGAVVLSIIGLVGIIPGLMAAVSAIAIGGSLLVKGLAVSAEYSRIADQVAQSKGHPAEFAGGMSGEILAGIAAIALGILSLLSIVPQVLLPCAAIVLGAGVFFSGGANERLNELRSGHQPDPRYERVMREAVRTSVGAQLLVSIGAAVLGILALTGVAPGVLTLVAFLSLGASELLSGSAVGGKMMTMAKSHA